MLRDMDILSYELKKEYQYDRNTISKTRIPTLSGWKWNLTGTYFNKNKSRRLHNLSQGISQYSQPEQKNTQVSTDKFLLGDCSQALT